MKLKRLFPVVIFLLCSAAYILAAFPSVAGGDSGEIITAAFVLGIPHPPGYPLYTLLGKIFTFLPVANIAFRVNLLAVFFGALASVMLYLMTVSLLKRVFSGLKESGLHISAAIVSLVFAFGGIFFEQAINAKGGIYTLNAFLMLSIIAAVEAGTARTAKTVCEERTEGKGGERYIFLGAFLLGLGVANHQTIILVLPSLLLYMYMTEKRVFSLKNIGKAVLFFVLGTAFYIYLPIRSLANPPLDWGNPENLTNLIAHITRKGYGALSKNPYSLELAFRQTFEFFKYLGSQVTLVFAAFGVLGLYLVYKADKKIFWSFLSLLLILGPGFILIINPEPVSDDWPFIKIFTLPAIPVFLVFAAAGIFKLGSILKSRKYLSPAIMAILILFTAYNADTCFVKNNHGTDKISAEYGRNVLKTMDKDGILFASDDNIMFPLVYFTMTEKLRPDVKVYDDYGWIFEHIYGDHFVYLPEKEQKQRRVEFFKKTVFGSGRPVYFTPGSRVQVVDRVQSLSFGLLKTASKNNITLTPERVGKLWSSYEKNSAYESRNYADVYSRHLAACYMLHYGEYLAKKGSIKEGAAQFALADAAGYDDAWVKSTLCFSYYRIGMNEEAVKCGLEAVKLDKKSSEANNNLALALARSGRKKEAAKYYQKASEANPDFSVSYYNTALMYLTEGKTSLALEFAEKAISISPDYYQAYIVKGSVYFANKKYDEAVRAFKKAKELNPSSPEARYNLGAVYIELGRNKEAKEELNGYLLLSPNASNAAQVKTVLKSLSNQ